MSEYPVWDPYAQIGTVKFRREGLYFHFESILHGVSNEFKRLYSHCFGKTLNLGLYVIENEKLICRGKVSQNMLGSLPDDMLFSIQKNYNFSLKPLLLNEQIIFRKENGRCFVTIRHENSLPDEIMSFFCFLMPVRIGGEEYLGFEINDEGRPVAQIMQE